MVLIYFEFHNLYKAFSRPSNKEDYFDTKIAIIVSNIYNLIKVKKNELFINELFQIIENENKDENKNLDEEKSKKPKKKKKPIPSTMKRLVWNVNIGEDIGKAKCLCCNTTYITQMSFHCGHIFAEANGGQTIVSNLKPICQNCNSSMGTKNMEEFMKSLK